MHEIELGRLREGDDLHAVAKKMYGDNAEVTGMEMTVFGRVVYCTGCKTWKRSQHMSAHFNNGTGICELCEPWPKEE